MLQNGMKDLLIALQTAALLYKPEEEITDDLVTPRMSRPLSWVVIEPVIMAIDVVQEVLELTRLRQLSLGSGKGKPLYEMLLASALVKRTHTLGDAERAVQELLGLVEVNEACSRIVMVLTGAQTLVTVELALGIELVPFKDLPPPAWIKEFHEEGSWPLSPTFDPVAPSAALVMQHSFSPVFTTEDQVENSFPLLQIAQLQTMANCIALTAERSPAILRVWMEDDDPRLPIMSSGVVFADPRWGRGRATPYDVDPEKVRVIYVNYLEFQGDRRPIDTAMSRLADASGGWHREERAIDLGIGLEVLLTHTQDGQGSPNTEISYKLGLRAGWLLGGNAVERTSICRKVRRLYKFRSEAAHYGLVKTKPDTWAAIDDEIKAGIALGGRIVIAILKRGKWSDWDELVFGGLL